MANARISRILSVLRPSVRRIQRESHGTEERYGEGPAAERANREFRAIPAGERTLDFWMPEIAK